MGWQDFYRFEMRCLSQSLVQTWETTKHHLVAIGFTIGIPVAVFALGYISPPIQNAFSGRGLMQEWIVAITGIALLVVFIIGVFTKNLLLAPSRMERENKQRSEAREDILRSERDEARETTAQLSTPSGNTMDETVTLLQAESITIKHNNGEELINTFADILLLLSYPLSVDLAHSDFESTIIKELKLDKYSGWYYPHDGEMVKLIGMFSLNNIVERKDEEHYRSVPDTSGQDITGITVAMPLRWLQEKNIEAKYHLTLFGSSVVKELHRQSTSTLQSSIAKHLLEGKGILYYLEKIYPVKDHYQQKKTKTEFEVWYEDISTTLKNTEYDHLWFKEKKELYDSDPSDYLEICRQGLNRLEEIKRLISDKEDSRTE